MNITVEWAATWIESAIVVSIIATVCGRRKSVPQTMALVLLFSVLGTVLIQALNEIAIFSYVTPLICMVFFALICARFLTDRSMLMRCISVLMAYILVQTIDYIVMVLMGIISGAYKNMMETFTTPGGFRVLYLIIDKMVDLVAFYALRKPLSKIRELSKRLKALTLVLCMISYAFMQFLVNSVLSSDIAAIQSTVILSWFFILCFLGAMLALFISMSRSENERQKQKILQTENKMMEENYQHINKLQTEYAKELHDFKHHVRIMKEYALAEKSEQIPPYADKLLETTYSHRAVCSSGCDIVDAVINCKYAEAEANAIDFSFIANLHEPISIPSTDICGILANQIDNAFDACRKIANPADRIVKIEIKQIKDMAFFRVENTVAKNPFEDNPTLRTTKYRDVDRHGFGLENIRSIAERYEGYVRNDYADGWFVSSVSLFNRPFDT